MTGAGPSGWQSAASNDGFRAYFNRAVLGPKLLAVDEIGFLPFWREDVNSFFKVVIKRHERGSMVLTRNLPFTQGPTPSPATRG